MHTLVYALLASSTLPSSPDAPSKWVRTLPGGVTVELLGVCDPAARTPAWWTPDGKPIAEPICDIRSQGASNRRHRGFAVRIQGPDINPTVQFVLDPYSGGQGGSAIKDGQQVEGVQWQSTDFPQDRDRTTLVVKVAATPWTTKATFRPQGPSEYPPDRSVAFMEPRATPKGMAVVVVEDYLGRDTRVVVVERGGKTFGSTGSLALQKAFTAHELEVRGIRPDSLERIELQVRPFETVEFPDVALVPAGR